MKKLLISIGALLIIGCTSTPKTKEVQTKDKKTVLKLHRDSYMEELMLLIRYFDNYYHSTEELLDDLDTAQSTASQEKLQQYLFDRQTLNELFDSLEYNSNHKHLHQ